MCLRSGTFVLENSEQTAEKCKQIFENLKKLPPLKHILALPIWGHKCIFSELQPFEIANFDLGHPVRISHYKTPKNGKYDMHIQYFKSSPFKTALKTNPQ